MSAPQSNHFFTPWRLGVIAVFCLAVGLYLPALKGNLVWDDHILADPSNYGSKTLFQALFAPFLGRYFRPVTALSYWADYRVYGGPVPMLWHQTNMIIHAAGALAVLWLTLAVTGRRSSAIFAGLLFAVMPAQVGAAAWIGGRTDSLAAFLVPVFLALLVRYFQSARVSYLVAAIVAFLLSVLAKEQCALLILAVPLAEFTFGIHSRRRLLTSTIAFGLGAVAYTVLYMTVAPKVGPTAEPSLTNWLHRVDITLVHYTGLLAFPSRSTMFALSLAQYASWIWILIGAVLWVGLLAGGVWLWRLRPRLGWLAACFLLAYLPISNLLPLPSLAVGPYRAAVASVLVAAMFGALAGWVLQRYRIAGGAVAGAYLVACGFLTYWGVLQWQTDLKFFTAVSELDPRAYSGQYNLSRIDFQLKDFRGSHEVVERYLDWVFQGTRWTQFVDEGRALPLDSTAYERMSTGFEQRDAVPFMLGDLLDVRGRAIMADKGSRNSAIGSFETAILYSPRKTESRVSLGDLLLTTDPARAARLYEEAERIGPSFESEYRLGKVRMSEHRYPEAESLFKQAVTAEPIYGEIWTWLAQAQLKIGNSASARSSLLRAENALYPDNAGAQKVAEQIK